MTSLPAALENQVRIARLAGRHARFAAAIGVRRLLEASYAGFPGLASARPLFRPVELVVAVSSVCQLSCRMCGIRKIMKQPEYKGKLISYADMKPVLREVEEWHPRPYIKFTGGEPLVLGEELLLMLRDCRKRKIPTRVSTNGILLADKELAYALVASGPDVVTVSLDGPADIHNAIRGKIFAFDKAVEGIRNLEKAKSAFGRKFPLVQVTSVLHAGNFGCLKEIYRVCRGLPIQWWNIQLLNFLTPESSDAADEAARTSGRKPGPWRTFVNDDLRLVDPEEIASAAAWIKRQRSPFAVSFHHVGGFDAENLRAYYAGGLTHLKKRMCVVPFLSMHIVPNGDMVFCVDYPYVTYGNIRTHALEAAWNSPEAQRFRGEILSTHDKSDLNMPQCRRCNWMFN